MRLAEARGRRPRLGRPEGRVTAALSAVLDPTRERRTYFASHPNEVREAFAAGTAHASLVADATMREVRDAMGLNYLA